MVQPMTQPQRYLKQITKEDAKTLFDLELADRSCESEVGGEFFLNGESFVGAFYNGVLVGVFIGNMIGKKTSDVHIGFPLINRKKAFDFAIDYINEVFTKTEIERIETEIPLLFPDVIRFTEKCGFTKEGIKRKNYYKNGKMHDSQTMGILRGDLCLKQ